MQEQFQSKEPLPTRSADLVHVESRRSKASVQPGATFEAAVVLQVREGWHVNAHRPLQDFLIGTTLDVAPSPNLIVADLRYPQPRLARFAFAEDELAVYEGEVPIFLSVRTSENVQAGADTLRASVRVQACNDQVCLRPSTIPVSIPVEIGAAGASSKSMHEDLFSGYEPSVATGAADVAGHEMAALFAERGLLLALMSIFLTAQHPVGTASATTTSSITTKR